MAAAKLRLWQLRSELHPWELRPAAVYVYHKVSSCIMLFIICLQKIYNLFTKRRLVRGRAPAELQKYEQIVNFLRQIMNKL